jgi:signal transduction histidine kinase
MQGMQDKTVKELQQARERRLAAEKLVMLNNLASVFAHRMDNIAGTIPVAVQEIKKRIADTEDETLIRYLQRLEDDARRLMVMARQLRRPLEAGQPEPVDVNSLLSTALRQVTIPKNVKVNQKCTANLPLIEAGRSQLLEVFVNIITNALEGMAPQGGELGIYSGVTENAKWIKIEITDTGCGMSEEVRKRLFDLFFTTKKDRMGLGLWWSKTFVQWLGGDILVKSKEGEGSSFTVRLPVVIERGRKSGEPI